MAAVTSERVEAGGAVAELLARHPDIVRAGADVDARHVHGFRDRAGATPLAVVYPRSTAEVSSVLAICNAYRQPVVPQGGMTGLAGGVFTTAGCIALSLERMRAIEELDPAAQTITVEAGVTMQAVQEAADAAGMLYPLDLGGRGTAQVGGNASTNAGGNRVLRFGMAKDLVLGYEAVLADGTVVGTLNKMLKANTGYDLKHLFLGSEGTLGIITRLVLRLFPKPKSTCLGLCAVNDFDAVLKLLARSREELGTTLSAFELMWPEVYRLSASMPGRRMPLKPGAGGYVLIETMGTHPEDDERHFEALMEGALAGGIVTDAVICRSARDVANLWEIRDLAGIARRELGPQVGFDISVPTGKIGAFIAEVERRLKPRWPEASTTCFGHVADGNIHFGVLTGNAAIPSAEIETLVYETLAEFGGAVSAEHGIGVQKRKALHYSRTEEEIALMRRLKAMMDPNGILNPGKVL
ncbi:MAG TPA: FAD-binding oxidoreductase [Hyphomicrobiales bacterium]|nr:FAD-binding oxidoreductase [Hyphomicrobiales bacterium]